MSSRGSGGSVAGLSRRDADTKLVALITRLWSSHGLSFTTSQAKAELVDMFPDAPWHSAMVSTLTGLPGIRRCLDGSYVLPASPYDAVKHRHWRMTLGYVDAADAATLHEMLVLLGEGSGLRMTSGLARLQNRLADSLFAAAGSEWRDSFLP